MSQGALLYGANPILLSCPASHSERDDRGCDDRERLEQRSQQGKAREKICEALNHPRREPTAARTSEANRTEQRCAYRLRVT